MDKLFSFFCFLISLLSTTSPLFADSMITVKVSANSLVSGEVIALEDIAEISGDNQEEVERLKSLEIGRSPDFGKTRKFSAGSIRSFLNQKGIDFLTVNLTSPEEVKVTGDFLEITEKRIKYIFIRFINSKINLDDSRIMIKDIRCQKKVILPPGKVTYEVISPPGSNFTGKINLFILFSINKKLQKKIRVSGIINIFQDVLCASNSLKRHQLIREEDIHIERRNSARLSHDIMINPEEVIGKRTKKAVKINMPLRGNFLELPPLVKRGDPVTVLAESSNFLIKTIGEVLEKGNKGQIIKVLNISSRKGIYARVIDSNTVRVEF